MIFRVAETELMPRLLVGYTEVDVSKFKKGNGFLKPNFGVGPNWFVGSKVCPDRPWIINEPRSKKVCPCLYGEYQ